MKKRTHSTDLKKRLDHYLYKAVSDSPVETNHHLSVVNCFSYYCPFSRKCANKTVKPSKISIRKCLRFLPKGAESVVPLSDLALDLLSTREQNGNPINEKTRLILYQYRPNGPLRETL